MQQGIYLTKPNNLFSLQNDITNNLNVFEKTKERYLQCNNPDTVNNVTPTCSSKDIFSNVTGAYENATKSIQKLENAMNARDQQNPTAVTDEQYKQNKKDILDNYNNIKKVRLQLDNQLSDLQRQMKSTSEPKLELHSSQFIYMLSVIAVICLIYLVVTMD
jgi:vacuolar-type H+-ATPase catalytic subunit A/Vma1